MRPLAASLVAVMLAVVFTGAASGDEVKPKPAEASNEGIEFFEKKIRPVLVEQCYKCHSAEARQAGKLRGKLLLDSEAGVLKGGETGLIVVRGKPKESRLLTLLRHEEEPKMPPKSRLSDPVISDFQKWIELGVPYPRTTVASETPKKPMALDLEAGRTWWAFRPVAEAPAPALTQKAGPGKKSISSCSMSLKPPNSLPRPVPTRAR